MSVLPRVLVLDDQRSILGVIHEILRNDFDVITSQDGDDALGKLRTEGPFQVVLSDMQMPGMDGVEFLKRANQIDPWSVKILLTGHAEVSTAMAAVNEGRIFRFLTKPCPPKQLLKEFQAASERFLRLDQQRRNVIGDKERISRRMVQIQGYALLGRFAHDMAVELDEAAARHDALLEEAIATASSGGFVSAEDLAQLGSLSGLVKKLMSRVHANAAASRAAEEVQLLDVVERALDRVRFLGRGVLVEASSAAAPKVHAVPELLEQAFTNLLENAFEALDTVEGASLTITIQPEPGGMVLCEIADNGPGIHPEVSPFVMRPFFTTNGAERAGLGLPVAQSTIESFGGTLEFTSSGEGACFFIRLPASTGSTL